MVWTKDLQAPCAGTMDVPGITTSLMFLMEPFLRQKVGGSPFYHMFFR
jgi:hypothetical protein